MGRNPIALLSLLLASTASFTARADGPTETTTLQATVEKNLLEPMAQRARQRSAFSRARMPPLEQRVRITETFLQSDARSHAFATFAVDMSYGGAWSENALVGCVYPGDGAIYIKRGEGYVPAALLLGKKAPGAPDEVCRPASRA